MDAKTVAETRTVTLTLEDDRIIAARVKPGTEVSLDDAKENYEAMRRLPCLRGENRTGSL